MSTRQATTSNTLDQTKALLQRLPRPLYRYYQITEEKRRDWLRDLIVNERLFFSRPSGFNDPLDCKVPIDFAAPADKMLEHWRRESPALFPALPAKERKLTVKALIRDAKTPKGRKYQEAQTHAVLDQNGISCFATSATNMLLWSYYAEGHQGVAVRFQFTPTTLARLGTSYLLVDVAYQSNFPHIRYYYTTRDALFRTIFGTKAIAWKHEEEWRIVLAEQHGAFRLPPGIIDGVILGMRTRSDDEAFIRSLITQRQQPIELLRVVHKPNSFDLELVRADLPEH
jgi:hypothetical protein